MLLSDGECSIVSTENRDIHNTHTRLLVFPSHSISVYDFFLLLLSAREKQNVTLFLCLPEPRWSRQSVVTRLSLSHVFHTRATGDSGGDRFFFPLSRSLSLKNFHLIQSSWRRKKTALLHCPLKINVKNEICSGALNFHYRIFMAPCGNDVYYCFFMTIITCLMRSDMIHTAWPDTLHPRDTLFIKYVPFLTLSHE